jgi:flagellar motor switch protein FliM
MSAGDRTLKPEEVDALLQAVEGAPGSADPRLVVHPYDFKRPERVSKEQINALMNLHEVFARSFGASLSGMLRTVCEIRIESLGQMTYQEFVQGLPNPTCFTVFTCEPLAGNMMIEFNPSVIFPVIDRLLGGGRTGIAVPDRPLTGIEWSLAETVTRRALEDLAAMWAGVRKLNLRPDSRESNPLLLQAVPPNELVVAVVFHAKIGSAEGSLHVCIPFVTIEPLVGDIEAQSWYPSAAQPAGSAPRGLPGPLGDAPVQVTAVLAETTITLRELLALEPGDVIETRRAESEGVSIRVEGRAKLRGRAATHGDRLAVEVSGAEGGVR